MKPKDKVKKETMIGFVARRDEALNRLIKELVKDEVDKALALSDKRRTEFKKQFKLQEQDEQQGAPADSSGLSGPTPPTTPAAPTGTDEKPKEEPKNPLEDIKTAATDLSKKTKDVPTILKAIKAKIQDNYKSLDDASEVVDALVDTKEPVLMSVAKRLEQFLKAGK